MTLLAGFTHPVFQAQRSFRLLLKALSEPGHRITLDDCPRWDAVVPAAAGVLLTLADGETPLYITPSLCSDSVQATLRFHTGAPLVQALTGTGFALFDDRITGPDLRALPCGDETSPESGATVLVQVASLDEGTPLRLRGPGIKERRDIAPALPAAVKDYLLTPSRRFPLGLDFILLCDDQLLAIPRTTHVEVC
ncbi:phosphonate C-P lyase system protein PhnH [Sodalis ligni]|uniref:phosphonate C-P lyase system protein PhnH n=1 Tax=Sodalis ligni TaxID=2697027 RepID=UPI00193F5CCD|nr:phosphonate C-P lyase system protein PhnH [Sodalis ligni]QWA12926.1 phosphonate C-P lyase system protein PhnH [Sodalis ligni]